MSPETHSRLAGFIWSICNLLRGPYKRIPETDEQQAIADFLDRETKKLDSLAAKIDIATERLQEYRAALITASVTGKIDTRTAGPPESLPSSGSSQREDLT